MLIYDYFSKIVRTLLMRENVSLEEGLDLLGGGWGLSTLRVRGTCGILYVSGGPSAFEDTVFDRVFNCFLSI